jgi:hypothetical protein
MERISESEIRTSLDAGFKEMVSEISREFSRGFADIPIQKKGLIGHLLAGLKVHVLSNVRLKLSDLSLCVSRISNIRSQSATSESNCNGEGARYVGGVSCSTSIGTTNIHF